jgi:hypothetical protein
MNSWPSAPIHPPVAEPWNLFISAREAVAANRPADAIDCWKQICLMPDLESLHRLQAWHFLRATGVQPTQQQAKDLLGVVIEVPLEGGLDLLAAYPDRSARFYSHAGGGIVWEHPDTSLDAAIDTLLSEATRILQIIGPWDRPRRPAPPPGSIRINVLSAAGLHFGEGPFNVLASDPLAAPTVTAATHLMQQLIERTGKA